MNPETADRLTGAVQALLLVGVTGLIVAAARALRRDFDNHKREQANDWHPAAGEPLARYRLTSVPEVLDSAWERDIRDEDIRRGAR